ncbi:MAG: hypothetical protein ACI97B_003040 [Verrucomicrobiales bacterium]
MGRVFWSGSDDRNGGGWLGGLENLAACRFGVLKFISAFPQQFIARVARRVLVLYRDS